MLFKAAPSIETIELYGDDRVVLGKHSDLFTHEELVQIIQLLNEGANEARWAPEPRIAAEVTLLSICRRSKGDNLEALLARIVALETQMSRKPMSIDQPLSKAPRFVESPPPMLRSTPAVSVATKSSVVAPSVVKDEGEKKETRLESIVVDSKVVDNIKHIWDGVLKELVAKGKRSVHACVSQGHLIALDEKQATVQFAATFPKERTEKDDYRGMIEKILEQICGKTVQLCCILGTVVASPKNRSAEAPKTKSVSSGVPLEGAEHPAVRQALDMFGGKITKKEEHKGD